MSIQGMSVVNIKDLIDPLNAGSVKKYLVYDVNADVTDIYTAQASVISGGQCIRQKLEYITVDSTQVLSKTSYTIAEWGGTAWDII